MRLSRLGLWAGLALLVAGGSQAATYTGSLQYTPPWPPDSSDGLYVGPSDLQWQGYTVTMEWTVTDTDTSQPGYPWKYTYHFYHNGTQAGFSHMIIETSDGIDASAFTGVTGGSIASVTTQTVSAGNPNMPEDVYGLRLNPPSSGYLDWTISFFSNRAPVWGDFYARCGGQAGGINYAYNYNDTDGTEHGFTPNDTDPTDPPQSGSIDYHILRPDSYVPEPATLGLMAFGGLALLRQRGRHSS